ncbi:MAG: acyltransferase [Oscillospiraceae bacterium]|nr:acyltransferase [Oscillospiraceae bacterium]
MKKENIEYISFLQFVGPIFVILGHSLNGIDTNGAWYVFSKQWIYIFHMPLFFMISGYLLAHNGWLNNKSYKEFIKARFIRLILPYLVWNLLFIVPKMIFKSYLNDSIQFDAGFIIKVLITPRQNIWGHTWFLVGLFIVYLFTPLWCYYFKNITIKKIALFGCIGILLYICPLKSEVMCISDLHKDLLFFWIGCSLGKVDEDKIEQRLRIYLSISIIGSLIFSVVYLFYYKMDWFKFIPCTFILSSLFLIGFKIKNNPGLINNLSKRSFGIYIMHWPVMLSCRIALLQIFKLNTTVTVIIMIIAGYIVPNTLIDILKHIKNKKIKTVCKYLLGV